MSDAGRARVIVATHDTLGKRWLMIEDALPLLFTDNETNAQKLYGRANASTFV